MNKGMKAFIALAAAIAAVLLSAASFLVLSLYTGIIAIYSELVYVIIYSFVIMLMLEAAAVFSAIAADRGFKLNKFSLFFLRVCLNIWLPIFIYMAGLLRIEGDPLKELYISLNNSLSKSRLEGMQKGRLLVLLPHCIQNNDCSCSITEDIQNCRRCGRCKIGEIADTVGQHGIRAAVAKGGTAARSIVKESKPDYILAVACERDLVSGIGDVGKIPVVGLINQRPNGYCNNTTLDMEKFNNEINVLLGYTL